MGSSRQGSPRRTTAVAAVLAMALAGASLVPVDPPFAGGGVLRSTAWEVAGHPVRAVLSGDRGAGAPVLWIHGSPGTWAAFRRYLEDPALRERAFQVAVDRPGFGGSDDGRAVPSLAEQVGRILPALDLPGSERPFVVVGHSLGGPVAIRLAAARPERVAAVVLIAPSVDPALERVRWYQRLADTPPVSWVVPRALANSNGEILSLAPELRLMEPLWDRVTAPVVVVHGARDRLVPVENVAYVRRMAPSSPAVEIVPDAGHLIPWTRPEIVRRALLAALDRPDP